MIGSSGDSRSSREERPSRRAPTPRFADLKTELKGDIHKLAERMERNHADFRHAIDTLILTDQAKRLTILKEAVLRTARPSDDREAQH